MISLNIVSCGYVVKRAFCIGRVLSKVQVVPDVYLSVEIEDIFRLFV